MTNMSSLRLGSGRLSFPDARDSTAPTGDSVGVATTPQYRYSIVPLTMQTNNIALAAAVSGATWTMAAGTGVTAVTISGVSYLDLGVRRNVRLVGAQTSALAVNVTVLGLDDYFQVMSATVSSPVSTATVSTTKCFRYVRSVTSAGNTVGTVSVGTGDVFGFPYRVDFFDDTDITYSSAKITAVTGFVAADATTPATALTGDVRGTYAVQSASDGVKRLTVLLTVPNANLTTAAGIVGVPQV
jgi:hypothetical protein